MGVGKGGLGEGLEWLAQFFAICNSYRAVAIPLIAIFVVGSVVAFGLYAYAPHEGSVTVTNVGTGSVTVSPKTAAPATAPAPKQEAIPQKEILPAHDDNPRQIFSDGTDAQRHGALDAAWDLYEGVLQKNPHSVSAMIRCSQVVRRLMANNAADPDLCRSKLITLQAALIEELDTPTGLTRHQIGLAKAEILEIDQMTHTPN